MLGNYGEPWTIKYVEDLDGVIDETRVAAILDCDGDSVIETDDGNYGPDLETAKRIVQCVNERAGQP